VTTPRPVVLGELTRRVAAHGLTEPEGAGAPLDPAAWGTFFDEVRAQRLEGLLRAAIDAGTVAVTDEQALDAHRAHATAMARSLDIEAAGVRVLDALADADVPHRVLKGVASAHLDHPDPSWRCFADVDLLLPGPHLERAVEVLAGIGAVRDLPERRRGFDARFGKEVTLYVPGAVEVDVHRTLALGTFGLRLPLEELWAQAEPFRLADRELSALAPAHRAVHAAMTAILGDRTGRVVPLRDLAQLLARPGVDPGEVVEVGERWGAGSVLALAVRSVEQVLALTTPLSSWAAGRTPSGREERELRVYERFDGTNSRTLLAGVRALRGRDRARYLSGLLLPAREYRRARRHAHRPNEWGRGAIELLGRRRA
jgi:hypothetical protein